MGSFFLILMGFSLQYSQSNYFPKNKLKTLLAFKGREKAMLTFIIGAFVLLYFQRGLYTAIFIGLYEIALAITLLQLTVQFLTPQKKQNAR